MKPFEGRRLAFVIACANALAIIIDFTSVSLKEFQFTHAMMDAPFEMLSLFALAKFYSIPGVKLLIQDRNKKE
ncbi:MAG: hypothetical protein EHM28_15630 [Spirochaetaceae bacterium]|nr:MAG: hypothetical protein EHM28_15630 [Spirochaetaceae bacterium]